MSQYELEPFRSKLKVKGPDLLHIPKYIPKKQSKYYLHHVHGMNTWMADHLYFKPDGAVTSESDKSPKIIVLALLHCNSRLFLPIIVPNQTDEALFDILLKHFFAIDSIHKMDVLITDYGNCFGKDVIKRDDGTYSIDPNDNSKRSIAIGKLLATYGVEHISYNMVRTQEHSKLALIDRVARTLRDMIYTCRLQDPSFTLNHETLKQLVVQYNTAPHATLSRIMHFPVSPLIAYKFEALQYEIIKRTVQMNYITASTISKERLRVGDMVWLYNPPVFGKKRRNTVEDYPYVITSLDGVSGFTIKNINDNSIVKHVTRSQIVPA